MSPSGPNQGEQLGQWELFYKGELLVIPLYTNSNTDKLNNGIAPPYINADVRNIFVTLNSRRYPEVDYQLDFGNNKFSRMFLDAINFKQKCFMDSSSPNLSSFDYKEYYPLYVIDVSNQSNSIKGQVTDITVRINFNSDITKTITSLCCSC